MQCTHRVWQVSGVTIGTHRAYKVSEILMGGRVTRPPLTVNRRILKYRNAADSTVGCIYNVQNPGGHDVAWLNDLSTDRKQIVIG